MTQRDSITNVGHNERDAIRDPASQEQAPEQELPNIAHRTAIMAIGTVLSRVTGLGRVLALIYALGATRLADTYNLANNLPNVVYELVLGGILSATLVPVFVDVFQKQKAEPNFLEQPTGGASRDTQTRRGNEAVDSVVSLALLTAVILSVIVVVAAPLIIRAYTWANHDPDAANQREVGTHLLWFFAPQIAFYGVSTVATAVLNARRKFAAPMFTPILNNLCVIGVLLATPHFVKVVASASGDQSLANAQSSQNGLLWLGLGTTFGIFLMAVLMVPFVFRSGYQFRFRWQPTHPIVKQVVRLSGWTLAFVAANQIALLIVSALANHRGGDVSIYQYCYVFFLLPHGIFSVSIMTGLLPELAEQWSAGRIEAFRQLVQRGIRLICFGLIPAAVGYVILAKPIVITALAHGPNRIDSNRAAATLAIFALGLVFFSTYLFLMRSFQAMRNTRAMFIHYAIENAINISLGVALYTKLQVQGLALAFALAYFVGCITAIVDLSRRCGQLFVPEMVFALLRIVAVAAVMGAVVFGLHLALRDHTPAAVDAIACAGIGGVIYLVLARSFLSEFNFLAPRQLRRASMPNTQTNKT